MAEKKTDQSYPGITFYIYFVSLVTYLERKHVLFWIIRINPITGKTDMTR